MKNDRKGIYLLAMIPVALFIIGLIIHFAIGARADEKVASGCPDAVKVLAQWTMSNGNHLSVCEWGENAESASDKLKFSGWINLYKNDKGEPEPYLKEVNTELPSEFYSFSIQKVDDKQIKIRRLVLPYGTPVTEISVNCGKKPCLASKEKCIATPKRKIDRSSIQKLEKVVSGKLDPQKAGQYYDVLIESVVASAMAGDKKALKLIMKTPREKLKVDGSAAESLSDGQRTIERMIELKCLSSK